MTVSTLPPLLLLFALALSIHVVDAATLTTSCTKVCGAFERCFHYDGAEHCAQTCAPGRCDTFSSGDTSRTANNYSSSANSYVCVLQGVECAQAPCLPRAVCEPVAVESNASAVDANASAASDACSRTCPLVDAPVCASDGVSYVSACFFAEAQCRSPGLELRGKGLCDADRAFALKYNPPRVDTLPPPLSTVSAACDAIVCAGVLDPVCTSLGTLRNACFFKRARCKQPEVEFLGRGACEAAVIMARCPASCTQAFAPVCASTGRIYANECLFRQAKCARPFASGFEARDLADCELNVGDSASSVHDYRAVLASAFD
ncbi:hypothetical protein PybrP1_011789 [[Pythium] brassicae (nom. inval.)]|nr:hypothetical protein PybrP1_011789 [[Pythium] brassicae (nom. inval.)]